MRARIVAHTALWVGLVAVHCGGGIRRFPEAEIVWEDRDEVPFLPPPESFYSPYVWDGMDQAVFRPMAKLFGLYDAQGEARNVNALDEVPDSSWFTNRLSRGALTPDEVARGACSDLNDDLPTPWTITGGKPDGSNPGFFIKDGTGTRYLLKTDGDLQHERPTGADAIGAAIYHSAGYYAPCNRVVTMTRDKLRLAEDAEVKLTSGHREAMTERHVEQVLLKATPLGEGQYRASVSQFIEGRPISPWRYEGTREDDLNDVIPHAQRRELRGMAVLAAWTDHIDSRQENTLAAWMETGPDGAGYVRHYLIDFGDCFGILFVWDDLARRFGHSGYFDVPDMVLDYLTLGLLDRPWYHARRGAAGLELGYYDARRFDPEAWKPGYPNPAFQRHTERDAAWMARILARFREPHIAALVERGRFTQSIVARELGRILIERRRRILERYLTRLSPLTQPSVRSQGSGLEVCLEDLSVSSGLRSPGSRRYEARAWVGEALTPMSVGDPVLGPEGGVCVSLSPPRDPVRTGGTYVVLDVRAWTRERDHPGPARVHLWWNPSGPPRVAGLERPETAKRPSP